MKQLDCQLPKYWVSSKTKLKDGTVHKSNCKKVQWTSRNFYKVFVSKKLMLSHPVDVLAWSIKSISKKD